jgi:RNA polymerase sigma factor (sigma-70 family)
MHPPQDESARSASAAEARVERLYEKCGGVLRKTLMQSFGIDAEGAEELLQQVLRAGITKTVEDEEAWVIAAVCRMAERRARVAFDAKIPHDVSAAELEALEEVIFLRDGLSTLPEPAQEALRLRFDEGRTYAEIAEQLKVSTRYVNRLVLGALERLRARTGGPR